MKKLFTLVLLATAPCAQAQHEADNWYFGTNAGVSFASGAPAPITGGQINTQEGCATISDSIGNLLFYSDGVTVWDKTHSIMPNGTGLLGDASSTQSCIIIAQPGSATLFYLFTAPVTGSANPFAYSIIDITLNAGNGDITTKNASLFTPSMEKVTATLHQNQTDVWIIAHESTDFNFYSYLLTASGLSLTPVISNAHASATIVPYDDMGQMKASPCGTYIAVNYHASTYAELYDFDNATGIISNPVLLGSYAGWVNYTNGIEFSQDESKVYVAGYGDDFLMQYDINAGSAAAIAASADTISIGTAVTYMSMQLAPDGKIYIASYNSNFLHCITNPNDSGSACNFILDYFQIPGGIVKVGLPTFPSHYFCQSATGVHTIGNTHSLIHSLTPNPATTSMQVKLTAANISNLSFKILNMLGACVYDKDVLVTASENHITIPLHNFSKGIYLLRVQADDGVEVRKFVVE